MKALISEIKRIYKKYPLKITLIWVLDLLEALFLAVQPYIIGKFVDTIIQKQYSNLIIFIGFPIIYYAIHVLNIWMDTRTYSKIIEEEHDLYYSKICCKKSDKSDSVICARLELVDDVPSFLEYDIFQIFELVLGLIFTMLFLLWNAGSIAFIFAFILSIIVCTITSSLQYQIIENNIESKKLNDERIDVIRKKERNTYKEYINKVLKINIKNSELDTKIFLITHFLQILLFGGILIFIQTENFTSGLLISIIGYISNLNSYLYELIDSKICIEDLKRSVELLKNN